MPSQEMTRFRLQIIETGASDFHILLVEEEMNASPRIAAEVKINARQDSMPRINGTSLDHNTVFEAANAAGQAVYSLEQALQSTSLGSFAAFRDTDAARGMISDAAYSWLLMNVVQDYDQGTIDVEDSHFVVRGNGKALAPGARRSGSRGNPAAGRTRPKRMKKLTHSWF